jgi:putative copper export protein
MDLLAQVWQPLIVCYGSAPYDKACEFKDLVILLQNLITDLILLSTLLATIAFAYAGLKLLTSGGNESARKEATEIFLKVLKGYLWILGAWLLVYTITSVLLNPGYSLLGAPR